MSTKKRSKDSEFLGTFGFRDRPEPEDKHADGFIGACTCHVVGTNCPLHSQKYANGIKELSEEEVLRKQWESDQWREIAKEEQKEIDK